MSGPLLGEGVLHCGVVLTNQAVGLLVSPIDRAEVSGPGQTGTPGGSGARAGLVPFLWEIITII